MKISADQCSHIRRFIAKGAEAAKRCAIALLATLRQATGSLNKVERLVKTTAMVNRTDDFTEQPEVINDPPGGKMSSAEEIVDIVLAEK